MHACIDGIGRKLSRGFSIVYTGTMEQLKNRYYLLSNKNASIPKNTISRVLNLILNLL